MANVGIMGAGSWGTALALLLHKNGHQVTVWSISEEEVEMLSHKKRACKQTSRSKDLRRIWYLLQDLEAAVTGEGLYLVLAVPSPFTRSTARKMSPYIPEKQIIVDVAKGIEEDTLMTLSQQIEAGDSAGRCSGIVRAKPCGRGRTRTSDQLWLSVQRQERRQNICRICL